MDFLFEAFKNSRLNNSLIPGCINFVLQDPILSHSLVQSLGQFVALELEAQQLFLEGCWVGVINIYGLLHFFPIRLGSLLHIVDGRLE